jgi:hypothetical protein
MCAKALAVEMRVCRQNLPHPQKQKERKNNKSAVQAYNNEGNIQIMVVGYINSFVT